MLLEGSQRCLHVFWILEEGTFLKAEFFDEPTILFLVSLGPFATVISYFFLFAPQSVDTVSSPFWDHNPLVSHVQGNTCSQSFCSASGDSSADRIKTRSVHKAIVAYKQSFFLQHFSFRDSGNR